jgi:hypothetical protein
MSAGFYIARRELVDCKNKNYFCVFHYILSKARWQEEPGKVEGITLKRGQCLITCREICDWWDLTTREVRTILDLLQKNDTCSAEIRQSLAGRRTLITVINYVAYQEEGFNKKTETTTERQLNDKYPTTERQLPDNCFPNSAYKNSGLSTPNKEQGTRNKEVAAVAAAVPKRTDTPYRELMELWNSHKLRPVAGMTKEATRSVEERWSENPSLEYWGQVFLKTTTAGYLKSKGFDNFYWVMRAQDNALKILSGVYDNGETDQARPEPPKPPCKICGGKSWIEDLKTDGLPGRFPCSCNVKYVRKGDSYVPRH